MYGRALIFAVVTTLAPALARGQSTLASAPVDSTCVLSAEVVVAAATELFHAAAGGAAIATFTGTTIPLRVGALSAVPSGGRVQVARGFVRVRAKDLEPGQKR